MFYDSNGIINRPLVIDIFAMKSLVIAGIMEGYEDDVERKEEMFDELAKNVVCLVEIARDDFCFWSNEMDDAFKIIEFLWQYDFRNKMVIANKIRERIVIERDTVVPDTTTIREIMGLGCFGRKRCSSMKEAVKADHPLCFDVNFGWHPRALRAIDEFSDGRHGASSEWHRIFLEHRLSCGPACKSVFDYVIEYDAINMCRHINYAEDEHEYIARKSIEGGAGNVARWLYERNNNVFDGMHVYMMEYMSKRISKTNYLDFCLDIGVLARVDRDVGFASLLMHRAITHSYAWVGKPIATTYMNVINGLIENGLSWYYDKIYSDCVDNMQLLELFFDKVDSHKHEMALKAALYDGNMDACRFLLGKIDNSGQGCLATFCASGVVNNVDLMDILIRKTRDFRVAVKGNTFEGSPMERCISNNYADIETVQYLSSFLTEDERNKSLYWTLENVRNFWRSYGIAEMFLRTGADPNYSEDDISMLRMVFRYSTCVDDFIELLIKYGATNVDLCGQKGISALECARNRRLTGKTIDLMLNVSTECCSCVVQ